MAREEPERINIVEDLIKPTDRQRECARATEVFPFVLYGGAAGGGKSYLIRWLAIYWLLKWYSDLGVKNAVFGVFCETFTEVRKRQVMRAKNEYPEWLGDWSGFDFKLKPEFGGGVVQFLNLDNPVKYRSVEFAGLGIDELTMNTLETILALLERKRWPGIDHSPFVAGTNPGGIGHSWVKRIWIDRNLPEFMRKTEQNPDGYDISEFCFIKSLPTDNPHNPVSYFRTLKNLPEKQRKAMFEGDWNAFAGQFFSSYTREGITEDKFRIPDHWRIVAGYDPGWRSPASFGLYGVEPPRLISSGPLRGKVAKARLHKIFNYYVAGRNDEEHAQNIVREIEECEWTNGRYPDTIIAGRDAFQRKQRFAHVDVESSDITTADIFEGYGLILQPCAISRVSRIQSYAALNLLIDQGRFKVFSGACEALHEEMAGVMGDENDPEDIQGRGNDPKVADHALDETRNVAYALKEDFERDEADLSTGEEDYAIEALEKEAQEYYEQNYDEDRFFVAQ